MAIAVIGQCQTDTAMDINLSDPIWTIEHVAAAFHPQLDTAREYTYKKTFPGARAGFSRSLWPREEVLAWFRGHPAKQPPTNTGTRKPKAYKPRPR